MTSKIMKSNEEWRKNLSPELYRIAREKGTEPAFTGKYAESKASGTYACACCGTPLFTSAEKYDSGSGWPSFTSPVAGSAVEEHRDASHGMQRTEVTCARCDAHLGHVFLDGPGENGLRYCINSASLDLKDK